MQVGIKVQAEAKRIGGEMFMSIHCYWKIGECSAHSRWLCRQRERKIEEENLLRPSLRYKRGRETRHSDGGREGGWDERNNIHIHVRTKGNLCEKNPLAREYVSLVFFCRTKPFAKSSAKMEERERVCLCLIVVSFMFLR